MSLDIKYSVNRLCHVWSQGNRVDQLRERVCDVTRGEIKSEEHIVVGYAAPVAVVKIVYVSSALLRQQQWCFSAVVQLVGSIVPCDRLPAGVAGGAVLVKVQEEATVYGHQLFGAVPLEVLSHKEDGGRAEGECNNERQ